jgi:hypothetical protein
MMHGALLLHEGQKVLDPRHRVATQGAACIWKENPQPQNLIQVSAEVCCQKANLSW